MSTNECPVREGENITETRDTEDVKVARYQNPRQQSFSALTYTSKSCIFKFVLQVPIIFSGVKTVSYQILKWELGNTDLG